MSGHGRLQHFSPDLAIDPVRKSSNECRSVCMQAQSYVVAALSVRSVLAFSF